MNSKTKYYLITIILLSVLLISITNQITLRDFPNSADEYSYLISAQIFSTGKLTVSSHQYKEFFNFFHIVNDVKFYSHYPPGWPFFLMFGILIKLPMLINLIFGILTILVTFLIAKEIASERVAKIAALFMATSPYFIFNSASYFSHSSVLFFLALAILIYIKNEKSNKPLNWSLLGIALGIAFNIRPFDTMVIGTALGIYHIYSIIKNKKPIKKEIINGVSFLIALSVLLGIFLIYNYLQTNDPFLTPLQKNYPDAKFGFNRGHGQSLSWALENNLIKRSIKLNIWAPFCLILIAIGLIMKNNYKKKGLLFFIFIALFTAYFFFALYQGNEYGPRYIYSSAFAIFVLSAMGIKRLEERKYNRIFPLIICLNLILLVTFSFIYHTEINQRMELYNKVKEKSITNAIVFLNCNPYDWCSGGMPALDLTRNDITFNNSVLYVHNLNDYNANLMLYYPNRQYYLWNCEKISFQHIKLLDFWLSKNINCTVTKFSKENFE